MTRGNSSNDARPPSGGLLHRLRERGVLRVAASYAVIAWLVLQIASVVLDPLGVPKWVLTALIIAAAAGFPIAIALAWFLEVGEHGVELDTAAEGVPRPSARGLRHYADAIVIGVLLIAVVVLLVRQSDIGKPKPPENPAIAVLPFDNLSNDPQQEYFSDGLAEEMLDRLGRVPGLRVIARSSSFSFKGKDLDSKTVAERLGVTTLLEGSVRRDGRRLKLSARLIDGATGQQAWSGSFDREVTDIFAVQAELAAAVVDAIIPAARGAVSDESPPPTTDLNAYDLYLLARTQLALRTPDSVQKSGELMQRAIELDPNFARAHAHLAASLLFQRMYSDSVVPEQSAAWLREAEASIHRALALDPDLPEAHGAYANLLRDTGRPGAEEEYERALELNANNATAWHDYAVFLGNSAGRWLESQRAIERSLELDPRQPVAWASYLGSCIEPGGQRYRQELERAFRMVGDMPGGLFRIVLPGAVVPGFQVEMMKAGLAMQRTQQQDVVPVWVLFFRAWAPVDPARAAAIIGGQEARLSRGFTAVLRRFLEAELAGLEGDWPRLDRLFEELRTQRGEGAREVASIMSFWLTVQERYQEAARALAVAEPIPDYGSPLLGADRTNGAMDTVKIRIYRATGRKEEAARLAAQVLRQLRTEQREAGASCQWDGWLRYAHLAANEGLRDEAVDALQGAMRCGDLPYGFKPQLPWFRSLEGYPPYDALLRDRERRIERIRGELQALEAGSVAPAPQSR